MKKYIIAVILGLLLPTVGYAKCCDCCQDKSFVYMPVTYGTMTIRGYSYGSKSLNDTGIEKLIGKMVHRTKPVICAKSPTMYDRSYIEEPRKLLAVTNEYLILSSDILASGQFRIERDIWDDGNWEEVKPQRLTVTEMIGTETFHTIHRGLSNWHCTKCGKSLKYNPVGYYCTSCKTGFDIMEE